MYEGRIIDIIEISENVAQIVLRKKDRDKFVPVAITISGFWKDKALKEMNIKKRDKIKGKLCITSKKKENQVGYYTNLFFREIEIVEKASSTQTIIFDTDTGEILE